MTARTATCIVTNCRLIAPAGDPYCARHRDASERNTMSERDIRRVTRPPARQYASPEAETIERLRRVETRVTEIAIALGVGVHTQKPKFEALNDRNGCVFLPSPHCSFKEILDNIPSTWDGPVAVFVGDELVATLAGRCSAGLQD